MQFGLRNIRSARDQALRTTIEDPSGVDCDPMVILRQPSSSPAADCPAESCTWNNPLTHFCSLLILVLDIGASDIESQVCGMESFMC